MRRHFVLICVLAAALAVTLGATKGGAADPACAGKLLCVTVTHLPQPASRSPNDTDPATDHFLSYEVKLENGGTSSNLVNLTLTMTWADDGVATTTSEFQPAPASSSACTKTGTQALSCTTPKSLGPGASQTYEIVLRTATELGDPPLSATGTTLTAKAAAKEQTTPSKKQGKNAVAEGSDPATYEPQPDLDVSRAGGGLSTTLATLPTAAGEQGQSSKLPVPADHAPTRATFVLSETSDFTCPTELAGAGFECFGQQVQTTAPGLSPVNVQITFTGKLPSGKNEGSIKVFHDRDAPAPDVTITATCPGAFGSEPSTSDMPCRRVVITDHLPNGVEVVEIDVWDTTNGRYNGG